MPWNPKDAKRHTKKATTPARQRQWAEVANSTLERTGNEGLAVREANSVVKHRVEKDRHMGRKAPSRGK